MKTKEKDLKQNDLRNNVIITKRCPKPFTVIEDAQGTHKMWISKKDEQNQVWIYCSFNILKYLPFVDGIESIPGITVDRAKGEDKDFSFLLLNVEKDTLVNLVEQLPDLMEKHLFQNELEEA